MVLAFRIRMVFGLVLSVLSLSASAKSPLREQRLPSGMRQEYSLRDWRFESVDALLPNTHGIFHSQSNPTLAVYSSFSADDVDAKDALAEACLTSKGTIVSGKFQNYCAVDQTVGTKRSFQMFAVKVKKPKKTGDPAVGIYHFWTAVEVENELAINQIRDLVLKGARP